MKINYILFALLIAAAGFLGCKGDYAVKVDGDTLLTIDDFNRYYYLTNKSLFNKEKNEDIDTLAQDPTLLMTQVPDEQTYMMLRASLDKETFLDRYINQRLVYDKAMKDDTIDKKELEAIIELTKIDTVNKYYLTKKMKSQILVSDAEVEAGFKKCQADARCSAMIKGRKGTQIDEFIRGQIQQEKFADSAQKFIRDIVQERGKIDREGLKKYLAKTKTPEKRKK